MFLAAKTQSPNHCSESSSAFPVSPSLGKKLGFTIDNGKLHNVSLGQGQEVVAENALDVAAEKGHWVILQVRAPLPPWHVTGDRTEPLPCLGYHPLPHCGRGTGDHVVCCEPEGQGSSQ